MSNSNPRRPNVLLIVSDDQRFDTIGALGNPHIHTPNLDSLVQSGYASDRHFCTTPICTPARAEILTGCNSFTNGVPWFGMPIEPELTLLPSAMKGAGYHTIHVGKWHNDGHPRDKEYSSVHCVFPADNLNAHDEHGHHVRFAENGTEISGHSSEVFTDAAVDAIHSSPEDKPWFCYLAYFAPHDPHHCPEPFSSMYDPATMPLFPNYMPEHPFDNGDMTIRDELLENWPRTQEAMRRYRARYHGIISHLDWCIGRLLGMLRRTGELENTLILFVGDQGLAAGSHGLLGKENMYDHSLCSPFIVSGPGVPAGARSRAMSHHTDIIPTICELTGVARPDTAVDGFSLVPVIRGEVHRVRDAVLCEFYSPEGPGEPLRRTQWAVRTERWKLTWFPHSGRFQLFDLDEDPTELVDLLVPWRVRMRKIEESGGSAWLKNRWAAVDLRPKYTSGEVDDIANELRGRMVTMMNEQDNPVPELQIPPAWMPKLQ